MQQAEIRGTRFRVAVIDSGMPDMTGFELAEQIKADRLLSEIKIIMLTSAGQAACCLRLGVAASLLKPIRKAELQSAILTALDERSPNNLPDAVLRFSPPEMSGGLRILVAEDNPVNQAVIVRMLQKLGHRPTIAHNGRQALSLLQGDTFDLVFMDVQMPEMDGLVATRTIRENEKRTGSHIPIVAMTAHAMKGYKESCLEAGMDDYLTKPLSSQSIDATLSRMFRATERKTPERAESCPSPSASPTWDRTKALERVEGDETLLRELVEIFLIEAPKQLENLAHAIVAADLDKIEKTAHSLKGELSYLGILDAAQKARDLERMGKEHSLAPAVALFPAFQTEMTALATEMRSMLDLC
jgi:CheY-like chemotaxis protein/HPt (histidine-containing phosphotransfer) domain-containing protein